MPRRRTSVTYSPLCFVAQCKSRALRFSKWGYNYPGGGEFYSRSRTEKLNYCPSVPNSELFLRDTLGPDFRGWMLVHNWGIACQNLITSELGCLRRLQQCVIYYTPYLGERMKTYREGPSHFAPLLHWQNVVLRHSFSSATIESEHQAERQKNSNEVWRWSK